jgi:hypothetical protein
VAHGASPSPPAALQSGGDASPQPLLPHHLGHFTGFNGDRLTQTC